MDERFENSFSVVTWEKKEDEEASHLHTLSLFSTLSADVCSVWVLLLLAESNISSTKEQNKKPERMQMWKKEVWF